MKQSTLQSSNDTNDTAAEIRHMSTLLEQVLGQNQLVLEVVSDMQVKVNRIPYIEQGIENLQIDMKVVKAAVTDTNRDLHSLERHVTRLERRARHD